MTLKTMLHTFSALDRGPSRLLDRLPVPESFAVMNPRNVTPYPRGSYPHISEWAMPDGPGNRAQR